ncbi:hypothetical protein QRX50_29175 [Amycolatopsis carbonis]|uniref:Uncharacterized protein n=1 Tax=Amycolatopsis carbonis TaxID=715471 RepID=A0A9Y2IA97_9PSEU|nr:hypothetical protein [Amycolatopsis sp. 2-15]WIX75571.1 hypothetical protein QRX50_29175 [Amycolatopsis sp. 2-15]
MHPQPERHTVLEDGTEPRRATARREPGPSPTETAVHYRLRAKFAATQPWIRRLLGERNGLRLDTDGLRVRLGPWVVTTPLSNLAGAETTGPFNALRGLGARLSLADHGLTLGTTSQHAVCIRFHRPIPGIDPWVLVRHPSLTATVAEPELVAAAINRIAGRE